jgi:hypothetical protein
MKGGDLVYIEIMGRRHMGIIESMDPSKPDPYGAGPWTREDYYWVVIPETGSRLWAKGKELEVIGKVDND